MRRFSKRTSWPATLVAPPRFESTRSSSANDLSLTMTAIKNIHTQSKLALQECLHPRLKYYYGTVF